MLLHRNIEISTPNPHNNLSPSILRLCVGFYSFLMSGSAPPPPPSGLSQSQASLLGPGITDLFIQGIETGLVFAKFSQWLYATDRRGSSLLSTVVVFVTLVGLCAFSRHFTVPCDFKLIVYEVCSPDYALYRLGLNTYCISGSSYVSLALAFCVGDTPLTL
jgi:hypothetical protein